MDSKFIKIAETELRETESRRNQSLAQMREWINKHPILWKINQEDSILLQFLRSTKFDVNLSCQKMENVYTFLAKYPEYFGLNEKNHTRAMKLLRNRNIFSLSNRDEHGQKILIIKSGRRDPKIFSSQDEIFSNSYTLWALQNEHESQIAGFTFILDFTHLKPETTFTPTELNVLFGNAFKISTTRIKKIIFWNLSSWMMYVVEIIKFTLSSKLRERIVVIKEEGKIADHVKPVSILTKEFGGDADEDEEIEKFFSTLKKYENITYETANPKIDWNGLKSLKGCNREVENVGSFRKLEVD